jgi:2-methylcitrate dehydratase PrpD
MLPAAVTAARLARFVLSAAWEDFPEAVRGRVKIALRDVVGAVVAGSRTPVAGIAAAAAARLWRGTDASILLSGLRASEPGAAFANGCLANALDIDDGYRLIKGHPGAVVFPAALAIAESRGASGRAFLAALAVGYEVAIRAGIALHATYHDYHGSGAWGALGAAASSSKILGLTAEQLADALGIAEYHGPLAPIMRCVEHPAMVKDGIGWGAMAGVSAALLAQQGFTGTPTVLEAHPNVADDLGRDYKITELYFKPYPCCRWAQPPIDGVRRIVEHARVAPETIERVRIHTFEAATHLGPVWPRTTEEAQYSLAWPVAAALVDGRVGPDQVAEARLQDARIREVASRVEAVLSPELEARFPAQALCDVEIVAKDGTIYRSGICCARGDPENPLTDAELRDKFHALTEPVIGQDAAGELERGIEVLEQASDLGALLAPLRLPRHPDSHAR